MLSNLFGGLTGAAPTPTATTTTTGQVGGWRRRHLKACRVGSRRCYNDNCVRKSSRRYKTTSGKKCRVGSHRCRDNRCHKMKMHYSRRLRS